LREGYAIDFLTGEAEKDAENNPRKGSAAEKHRLDWSTTAMKGGGRVKTSEKDVKMVGKPTKTRGDHLEKPI